MKNLFLNHNKKKGVLETFVAWFMAFSLVMQGLGGLPLVAFASNETAGANPSSVEDSSHGGNDVSSHQTENNNEVTNSENSNNENSEHNGTVDNSSATNSTHEDGNSQGQGSSEHSSGSLAILQTLALNMNMSSGDNDDGHRNDKHHKITICHIPQGNPENAQSIDVDEHSVTYIAHLKHGDTVGPCEDHGVPPPPPTTDDSKVTICHISEGNPENAQTIVVDDHSATLTAHMSHGDTVGPCENHDVPPPPPTSCAIDVMSDTNDKLIGGANAVATYSSNPRWTAVVPGATWIWKTFFVVDPIHDETANFTKDFVINGTIASATMTLAADNSFSASVNSTIVGSDNTEFNYFEENKHVYDVASSLHTGTNTLAFEVKNWAQAGGNAQTNPAGLLYKLHVVYLSQNSNCTTPPPVANTPPVITLIGDNPLIVTQGSVFTDPGAISADNEDGDLTSHIIATGTVDTSVLGTTKRTYTVTDSGGLSASTTRTVIVKDIYLPPMNACEGVYGKVISSVDGWGFHSDNIPEHYTVHDGENQPTHGDTLDNSWVHANGQGHSITWSLSDDTKTVRVFTSNDHGPYPAEFEEYNVLVSHDNVTWSAPLTATATYIGDINNVKVHDGVKDFVSTSSFRYVRLVQNGISGADFEIDALQSCGVIKNQPPVITVTTPNPTTVLLGGTFTDLGATASDPEDGDITANIVATGTVNTNALGTYTITYNVMDSQGLAATPKTRTVNVVSTLSCKAPLDVIIVIDRSGSMADDGSNPEQPLTQAKDAAKTFIDTLSSSTDHVGVVSYNLTPTLNQALTGNFAAAKTSFAGINAGGGTDIADAIGNATDELALNGRPNAKHIIILLSDGKPDPDVNGAATALTIQKANAAKTQGIVIYTIGLGSGVNPSLMQQVATLPADYYFAPTGADLTAIYGAISATECHRDPATISGMKVNDLNGNGVVDQGEVGLANWNITLTPVAVPGTNSATARIEQTDASGNYVFSDVVPGTYNLCELNKTGWNETFPTENSGCYPVTISDGDHITGKLFLNYAPPKPACSDGIDNDHDGKIDYPADTGCDNPQDNDENNKPVITVTAPNPTIVTLGGVFTDPGATAFDQEDGTITPQIVRTGSVNVNAIGTYTLTYNVHDSQGLAAVSKTRTVKVMPACSDGIDNDHDGKIDYPADTGCTDGNDNDENNKPVITVLGVNPTSLTVGSVFTDLGATAFDQEDGTITPQIVTSGTVNTSVVGTYTITYNVSDSKGLAADQKTRTVNVNPPVTQCNDGIDNDGDGKIDYPADTGCDNPQDNDENNKPVITVIAPNPMTVTIGGVFTDTGATAFDQEDGTITPQIVASGTVNTANVGAYTVTYNVSDSKGLAADQKTRIVNVTSACSDGIDNDNDGKVDMNDSGCDNPNDNSENEAPVITLLGNNPLSVTEGDAFTDPSATVADHEDGNITAKLVTTGTVNTAVLGSYTITYNATDSQNLAATPVTRTVNVLAPIHPNTPPVITLVGSNPAQVFINTSYVDQSATAFDAEDGDITAKLVTTGTVNTAVLGSYTITYNATDSQNLAATPVTRTVNVVSAGCTVNCGGGGGSGNTRPVITVLGANPLSVTQNTTFTDPGATAFDSEDGDITSKIVATGTVNTSVLGAYTITYDATDTQNLPAQQKSRVVNVVVAGNPGCTSNCGGGGGGGGGGSPSLYITNEKLVITGTTTVTVTWDTNLTADSRVVYGLNSVPTLANPPYYGYQITTATDTTLTIKHTVVINGIPSAIATYFRPVSSVSSLTATGIELTRVPDAVVGGSCEYLKEYMRLGINNNPIEVTKLQLFLKNFEGYTDLAVTGFFDITTDRAVRGFQDKYKSDVLDPWDLPGNTGYVYYTTKKKVNEIYCQRAFPLNAAQLAEVAAFRELIARINAQSTVAPTLPLVGINSEGSSAQGTVAGASTLKDTKPFEGVTISDVPGTQTATETDNRGHIALSDLLAIPSSMSNELGENNGTATDVGVVAGASTRKEGIAAVIDSLELRIPLSPLQIYLIILLVLLAIGSALYFGLTKSPEVKSVQMNIDHNN